MAAKRVARGLGSGPKALEAVASPARQELLSALGNGPATVTELAERLGRTRQALYYHVRQLAGAGLVREAGERGAGRDRERVWALAVERVAVGARAGHRRDLATADRAVGAMLRLTAREVRAAIASGASARTGARRELLALRGKSRLEPQELARLNGQLEAIERLLVRAKARPAGRLYSLTIVLTPSREAATTVRRARGRARRRTR